MPEPGSFCAAGDASQDVELRQIRGFPKIRCIFFGGPHKKGCRAEGNCHLGLVWLSVYASGLEVLGLSTAQQETFHNVQVLYILSKGLVALNSRIGGLGEVWGEDFVLSDTSLIRPVAGYALTYVELLSLAREDYIVI